MVEKRTHLVESFHQHALVIEIGETERSVYLLHAPGACPTFSSTEKRIYHFVIVNKVDKSKTGISLLPDLICFVIDDNTNPPDNLLIPVSQKIASVTMFKCRILASAECVPFIVN